MFFFDCPFYARNENRTVGVCSMFMGQCEQAPGAITQGKTIEEVKENLKEAIALVLESGKRTLPKSFVSVIYCQMDSRIR